jgi:hypothetical protein
VARTSWHLPSTQRRSQPYRKFARQAPRIHAFDPLLTSASREWMSALTSEAVIPRLTTWSLRIAIPPASAVPIHGVAERDRRPSRIAPYISFSRDLFYDLGDRANYRWTASSQQSSLPMSWVIPP